MLQINLISGQNDFNLGCFVISLSLLMIMNTRDREITDQPKLNHFDLKSNSTCNIYLHYTNIINDNNNLLCWLKNNLQYLTSMITKIIL